MTYEKLRLLAGNGDLLFIRYNPWDPLSTLTRFWTGCVFSHVGILFWYAGRLLVVESTTHGGNRIVNASIYAGRDMVLAPAPKPWPDIQHKALGKMGTIEYGWLSAIHIGVRDAMFRRLGVSLPKWENRNLACSEYVADVLGLEDTDIPPRTLWERYGCAKSGSGSRTGG